MCDECEIGSDVLEEIYDTMSDMFEERVITAHMLAKPTYLSAQLIRESSNCPSGLTSDILGLLDVGLMHHNDRQTKHAVATYIEAIRAWFKNLRKGKLASTHSEAQAGMFCMCCIGAVLESDTTGEPGEYDPIALAIYMLAVALGESKAPKSIELALAHSSMGSVLFHIGIYRRALECYQKASLIRTNLALDDVHPGQSVTPDEMAIVWNNTGVCHAALDENVAALNEYRKAYHIFREHCGANHMYTAAAQRNIERVQHNIAEHDSQSLVKLVPDRILRPKKEKKGKKGKGKKKK